MSNSSYRSRSASGLVERAIGVSPVVVVMGARQVGKTTLVTSEPAISDRLYLSLDDLDVRERAESAPDDLVRSAPKLTLDEVQREPDLIPAIKRAVDEDRPRSPGRFLVTGSANLLLMQRISESLAGRATYVSLWPLTRRERLGLGRCGSWSELLAAEPSDWYELLEAEPERPADWKAECRRGGLPVPALELGSAEDRSLWFDGYVRTYLERDLQDLAAIDNLVDFRRLMRAAALRLGNLVNQTEIGRDTEVSRPTAHRYLNLLETSFQLVRLEPYAVNRTKRLVKSPKLYWSDTGLALHLAGGEPRGAHLENLVLSDLLGWRDGLVPRPEVLYWRTSTGQEVDLVIEDGERLLAIEVKASRRVRRRDLRGIEAFRDEYPERFAGALVLYDGSEIQWVAERVLAAPWHRVL